MTRQPIKQLTLYPHIAALVALGAKPVETRSWATPYRGLIAIVAGKGMPCRIGARVEFGAGYEVERDAGGLLLRHPRQSWPWRVPVGAVVATVKLVDIVPTDDVVVSTEVQGWGEVHGWTAVHPDVAAVGDFSPRRFAWLFDNVRRVQYPIPQKGSLGLRDWTPPPGWSYSITEPAGAQPVPAGAAT